MKNVFKYILYRWYFIAPLLLCLVAGFGLISLFRSCSYTVENISNRMYATDTAKVRELLTKTEILEKKDSIIQSKIEEIDSLRIELGGLTTDVDELHRYLSDRYRNRK